MEFSDSVKIIGKPKKSQKAKSGVEKIHWVRSFSADMVSSFTEDEVNFIKTKVPRYRTPCPFSFYPLYF
ncbi:unnamed protein product [Rhizophagus irregularis]|nr:unnamed protein product [Rhizophagus irregularis]